MDHSVTVRAQERKIARLCLAVWGDFRDGYHMVNLYESVAQYSIAVLEAEPADLTVKTPVPPESKPLRPFN
jgi:hypothetical protein